MIEIGTQHFLFILAEQKTITTDQYDPLVNHKWRSSFELQDSRETTQYNKIALPRTKPHLHRDQIDAESRAQGIEPDLVTSKLHTPPSLPAARGVLLIGNGELAGRRFALQSLSLLVGSGLPCDLVVPNLELAPVHARFIRDARGDYLQNLSEQGGTLINGVPVREIQLLQHGDHLRFGSFHLTYLSALQASEESGGFSQGEIPASNRQMPLRLPSRPKET